MSRILPSRWLFATLPESLASDFRAVPGGRDPWLMSCVPKRSEVRCSIHAVNYAYVTAPWRGAPTTLLTEIPAFQDTCAEEGELLNRDRWKLPVTDDPGSGRTAGNRFMEP
jgi:hypothetical protein